MNTLPAPGRIDCSRCFAGSQSVEFDQTRRAEDGWRITANPLAWGNEAPEVLVLGFSKGPTQAGALATAPHNEIAYKGNRANVGKILAHLGLMGASSQADLSAAVSREIANPMSRFHFASLIRCTVERFDGAKDAWMGSGGGMLDKFVRTAFGHQVAKNCSERFLAQLPNRTKLVVMFGLGSKLNYVHEAFKLYQSVSGGTWTWLNDVSYTDGKLVVVHVEHFASQGALIPQWIGAAGHERGRLSRMAREAVELSGVATSEVPEVSALAEAADKPTTTSVKPANRTTKKAGKPISGDKEAEVAQILDTVQQAGYAMTKDVDKVAAFKSPRGQILYVVKTSSRLNNVNLMAHPSLNPEVLRTLDGVQSVSDSHRFHSNMTDFPKRLNNGKTETAFGWHITVGTIEELPRFLRAFKAQF